SLADLRQTDNASFHIVLILPVSGHCDSRDKKYTTPSPQRSTTPSSLSDQGCSRSKSTRPALSTGARATSPPASARSRSILGRTLNCEYAVTASITNVSAS